MNAVDRTPAWGSFALPGVAEAWKGLLAFGISEGRVAQSHRGGLVYLATPYSREVARGGAWQADLSQAVAHAAARHQATLCAAGVTAVSPIVQAHAVCLVAPSIDPMDEAFWTRWCQPMLAACDAVVVPDIPGWDRSAGVWREALWALSVKRPVLCYGRVA